jgi:glucan biosynthesis protein C
MTNSKRIHGIDALRAVAMMLGIVLHSSIAYKVRPHRNWIHDSGFNNWMFDYLYFFIHSFRMAIFFLIAGFFCRLVYYRSGEKKFIQHRWKRVGLPFVLSMILIVPVSLIPYNFYFYHYILGLPQKEAYTQSYHRLLHFSGLSHLWFLYDLLLFYTGIVVFMRIKRITAIDRIFSRFSVWIRRTTFTRPYWVLLLTIPLWLSMIPGNEIFVITDTYLIPRRWNNLAFYGYLFILGWLIQQRMDIFDFLVQRFRLLVGAGLVLSVGLFLVQWNTEWPADGKLRPLVELPAAFLVFCFTFGMIGLFLHYFKKESYFWKYISDASYWVYLIHLIVVTGMQLWFLDGPVPGPLRFPVILAVTLLITFGTYQYGVRYTFIGDLLHGHRERPVRADRKIYVREQ